MRSVRCILSIGALSLAAAALLTSAAAFADHVHKTKVFAGVKVNGGTVTHSKDGKDSVLTLSDERVFRSCWPSRP